MIWMTWRQHRRDALAGAIVFIAITVALIVLGVTARSDVRDAGLGECLTRGHDCTAALSTLSHRYRWLPPVAASLFPLPLLAGMFWAAPIVAREIETGTHRLAWTQTISRRRWISTTLALILAAAASATLAISLIAQWT